MKFIISILKYFIFSHLFVSLCVTAFTHLTFIIYNIPKNNILVVLLMVFSFTFFTYNGQRLYRLHKKTIESEKLGERLIWVIQHKVILTILSAIFVIIGFACTLFINPKCFAILVPIGSLSMFYVVPILFHKKSPSLRDIPYLKIIIIGVTWAIAIVWLPMVDTKYYFGMNTLTLFLSIFQVFIFIIAITLPFDIRDIQYDKMTHLKTIPRLIGTKNTVIFSELLLAVSIILLYFLPIGFYFYPMVLGHIITMIIIGCTTEKRNELFFAGVVEGTIVVLYSFALTAYLFF